MEKERREKETKLKTQERKVRHYHLHASYLIVYQEPCAPECTQSVLYISSPQVDYFERAKRLVEVSLLRDQYQQQIDDDRLFHEEQEEERVGYK